MFAREPARCSIARSRSIFGSMAARVISRPHRVYNEDRNILLAHTLRNP